MTSFNYRDLSYIHNYLELDEDKEVVVFIHGLQSSKETFSHIINADLLKKFTCLSIDQRGHGDSPAFGEDYTAESMARDVLRFLREHRISKVHLVGHSMGGRTAMAFLKLYPELVSSLIIEDIGPETRQEYTSQRESENYKIFKQLERESMIYDSVEEIRKILTPLYTYAEDLIARKVSKCAEGYRLSFSPAVSVRYGYQANNFDYTETLKSSDVPIIFFQADPIVGSAMTEKTIFNITKNIPKASIHFFPKAWHSIHKVQPLEFTEAVFNFISKCSAK